MTRRPKLRDNIVVRRLTSKEETYIIVKDPDARQYYKFEDWEYDLLALLDGTRDLDELTRDFGREHPEAGADRQYMLDYLEQLRLLNLLEKTEQERHLVMMDRLRELRKKRFFDAQGSSIFAIIIPLFDPDRLMNRVIPWIRWWWQPWVILFWLVVFTLVLGFLTFHWDLYWRGFIGLWNFPEKTLFEWVGFFVLMFGVSVWHELGHGFTCKRFGGEVHDIGVMLFYMQPVFYCGIDDSYLFPKLSHRIYSALGGVYFELMLCSVAAAIWLMTPAEWWIHSVALTVVFFTGLSAIVFNMNPLIKFDAYYILMDWLDVPNLREESFGYLGSVLRQRVFRLKTSPRPISRRRRRIYLVYGSFSILYTALILVVLYLLFRSWLVGWLGPVGYLLALALVGYIFRRLLFGFVRFVKHFYLDKKELLRSWYGRSVLAVGILLLLVALTVPRFHTRIESSFVVEPAERVVVRAPQDGVVREVRASEGDRVREAEPLAVLTSPDLAAEHRRVASNVTLAVRRAAEARRRGDLASARERLEDEREARGRLALLEDKLEKMTLRAPMSGVVSTAKLESTLGRFLPEGGEFCSVDRLDTVKLIVMMSELELEELREGLAVRVLPSAHPFTTLEASILSLAPVAVPFEPTGQAVLDVIPHANLVRLEMEVDNPDMLLRPGMTGRVQVLARPRSVVEKVWWWISRWAGSQFW